MLKPPPLNQHVESVEVRPYVTPPETLDLLRRTWDPRIAWLQENPYTEWTLTSQILSDMERDSKYILQCRSHALMDRLRSLGYEEKSGLRGHAWRILEPGPPPAKSWKEGMPQAPKPSGRASSAQEPPAVRQGMTQPPSSQQPPSPNNPPGLFG